MFRRFWLLVSAAVCSWTVLLSAPIWAIDPVNVDDEVYESCDQVSRVARQAMSAEDYALFLNMTEEECLDRFGGRTRSELKAYLAAGGYRVYWQQPLDVAAQFAGSADEFTALYLTGDGSQHVHDDSLSEDGHVHPHDEDVLEGIGGAHGSDIEWVPHAWRRAGARVDHLRVTVDLRHHYFHFHTPSRNFHYHLDDVPIQDGDKYFFYRNIRVTGQLNGPHGDGARAYRITSRYEYKICDSDEECDRLWKRTTRRTQCLARAHREESTRQCYVVE